MWNTRLWSCSRSGPDCIIETDAALAYLDSWRCKVLRENTVAPILDVLLEPDGPGAGIGQHLANNLLFEAALHPDMPSVCLCRDDALYSELRALIPRFMAKFVDPVYFQGCDSIPNTKNPFSFNSLADNNFCATYVRVYRKNKVRVSADLYNLYQSHGLLDPSHVVGEWHSLYI
ncbi:hypothetical protein R3P38DRAFT_2491209 [Favolaschia claudopus]|uniref:Uncharacterized protein n=1 Tax=Favolaschia claudopus TaxID=2862362 RepID=A0AAW0EIU5_9AGAR